MPERARTTDDTSRARRSARATGWRKVASAIWAGPYDPQIYGDIEIDAGALLAFIERVRAETGTRVADRAQAARRRGWMMING